MRHNTTHHHQITSKVRHLVYNHWHPSSRALHRMGRTLQRRITKPRKTKAIEDQNMEVAELQAEIEGIKENKKVLAEVQKDRQEKLNILKGMSSWSKMGPRKPLVDCSSSGRVVTKPVACGKARASVEPYPLGSSSSRVYRIAFY